MFLSLINPAQLARSSDQHFVWDWRVLALLLAIGIGSWGLTPLATVAFAAEESSESGEEEESTSSPEEVGIWNGRSAAARPSASPTDAKPLLRLRLSPNSVRESSSLHRGSPLREGHFLPGGVNAPRLC